MNYYIYCAVQSLLYLLLAMKEKAEGVNELTEEFVPGFLPLPCSKRMAGQGNILGTKGEWYVPSWIVPGLPTGDACCFKELTVLLYLLCRPASIVLTNGKERKGRRR